MMRSLLSVSNASRRTALSSRRALAHAAPKPGDKAPAGCPTPSWATMNPETMSAANPAECFNHVNGQWTTSKSIFDIPDPMNGEAIIKMPDTQIDELQPFVDAASSCPKTGLHNPLKNKERYLLYGDICHKAGVEMSKPEVHDFYAKCIARVMPKSYFQAWMEVKVTADFLKNFAGDNPRFIAGGSHVPGDYLGQESKGYRWPFGPVCMVAPFNFPLEIPVLQVMGALMMGNRPTIKCASITSLIMEQYIRMLIHCGMPPTDLDLIHCGPESMSTLSDRAPFRVTQFTGSTKVAETIAKQTGGKIRIEDAGFDWKILGPDVNDVDYVAWQCDQDAYACSGQKCSAQSMLFMHENWEKAGIQDKIKQLAATRNLDDLSIGPVMTHTTENILAHTAKLAAIPGAYVAWGGKELKNHSTPEVYGMVEPTAVYVPLEEILKEENFEACATEIFGPFQVLTSYNDESLPQVLEALERMSHHLTAAVVSNDPRFQDHILGNTVNGTTYAGLKARTTGAPQNHWFGPGGDPRGAGIGTAYAIQLVWSCHREIISDTGVVPEGWTAPKAS